LTGDRADLEAGAAHRPQTSHDRAIRRRGGPGAAATSMVAPKPEATLRRRVVRARRVEPHPPWPALGFSWLPPSRERDGSSEAAISCGQGSTITLARIHGCGRQ
jgi:hypothetical protein